MKNESLVAAPLLSVIVVAASGAASVARTLSCLRKQSVCAQIELILVVEKLSDFDTLNVGRNELHSVRLNEVGTIAHRGVAAASAVPGATASLVGLLEDHSFPESNWAESIIRAHDSTYAGVGPAVANANPNAVFSWVNFVLGYGAFSPPQPSGAREILPWHNSTYKRELLIPFGAKLAELLAWEGSLQFALRSSGHELHLAADAVTHHANVSKFSSTLKLNYFRGRILGALRVQHEHWTLARRVLHACAFPLFPFMQLRHLWPSFRREPMSAAMRFQVFCALIPTLVSMAVGEGWGILSGTGDALDALEDFELHRLKHISRSDMAEALAFSDSVR